MSSPNHPYLSLPIPSDAPFELKPSPRRGWGAFAKTRIPQGAIILTEKPLFVIQKPSTEITEHDVLQTFNRLPPAKKQQFLLLRENAAQPFNYMEEAFCENSFNVVQPDGATHHGLFLLHSRFNHSCMPNTVIPANDRGVVTSFAIRDILPGEEITFLYNRNLEYMTRGERQIVQRFMCSCKTCTKGGPLQQELSDMRRRLARGLEYLINGQDVDRNQHHADYSLIIDLELKKAAEGLCIPFSSRFIYNLLIIFLIEEEGLLDNGALLSLHPRMEAASKVFKTAENARLAKLVMEQESWREKVFLSFRLWGREDAADHDFARLLQMSRELL
ncbi:SET domain-containing protein 5 [Cladobotryum mycophilum]|uniref:SET domain-containing protein 5 n=1 Tax=Cladobotryum mycophilum TaxID=491253 RepID=A0ABR0S9P8_9HYPO